MAQIRFPQGGDPGDFFCAERASVTERRRRKALWKLPELWKNPKTVFPQLLGPSVHSSHNVAVADCFSNTTFLLLPSALLSNLVLDELDRELERRQYRFVRYADDCNIYVASERAGKRVMQSVTSFIQQRLKLKVNEAKSAVARPQERKFLGFSFTGGAEVKRRIAPKALLRCKRRVRELTRRTRGISLPQMTKKLSAYLRGWKGYFGCCQTPSVLHGLDNGFVDDCDP